MLRSIDDTELLTAQLTSKIRTNIHYFPISLKSTMNKIPSYVLTIVEAASGYGKTTCIRHFFSTMKEADVHWISFSENETPEKAWNRCCYAIKKIDSDVGNRLFSLGLPSLYNTDEICQLLYKLSCEEETYLVFDNFQFIQNYFTKAMWEAFLFNNSKFLHIVALTQIINKESEFLTHFGKCLYLSSNDLKFSKTDIEQYFKKAGLVLTNDQLVFLYKYSEGWIAPLYLQLVYFSKHQKFQKDLTVTTMIEKVVLDTIEKSKKLTLISLSLFEYFSEEQIAYIIGNSEPCSLEKIPLLSYDKRKSTYTFHSILRDVLQIEFSKLPKPDQVKIMSLSAQWYIKIGNIPDAIVMYCKIAQYDKVISLIEESSVFDSLSMRQSKSQYLDLLRKIAFTDIDDLITMFPSAYVLIAFEFFTQNCYEEYAMICETLQGALESDAICADKAGKIKGELALVQSFSVFNNISQMGEYHQRAFKLLNGKSSSIMPRDPWTFGNPSVVSLYWSEIGKMDQHMEDMDRCIPLYSAMVKGHGTGADTIFRAEIALLRGDDSLAENLCYKGIFQTKSVHQESLYLAAVFILLRVAMLRGNKEMYELCAEYLVESEKTRAVHYELSEIALINCHTRLQFHTHSQHDVSTQSLLDRILPMSATYGFCLLGRDMLLQEECIQLQLLYEEAWNLSEALNSQLTRLYFTIYMAVAKMQSNHLEMAKEYLLKALDIALPDRIILPFAENYDLLKDLFNAFSDLLPSYMTDFCNRYKKGLQRLKKNLYSGDAFKELTPMEYEVYILASAKKKNKEIAKELFITENTVKTHLAHIYSKLGVKSKTELS